jgi:serine/threonine protein kinase
MNKSDAHSAASAKSKASKASSDAFPDVPSLGSKILEKYKVIGKKEGGFGVVLFVQDVQSDQKLVAKTYKSAGLTEQRFRDEMAFWFELEPHPNIVQAYSVEIIEKRPYLFLEYVSGQTLREWIGKLDFVQALSFAYQICLGMEHINRKNEAVHGDLKPENILVTSDGVVKITDFGLARYHRVIEGKFSAESAGTLPYMSYEHLKGEPLDQRSDIYSFGVIMYEMFMGRLPYDFPIQNLTRTQYSIELEKFCQRVNFNCDDSRFVRLWDNVQDPRITQEVKDLTVGCMYPRQHWRWDNFKEIGLFFDKYLREFLPIQDERLRQSDQDLHAAAVSFYQLGRLNRSLSLFNKALIKEPDNAELWRDAASALLDVGDSVTAANFLRKALHLDPAIEVVNPELRDLVQ